MILHMFAICDTASDMFMAPFCMRARGEAVRAFLGSVSGGEAMMTKFPEQFVLYHIGHYDDNSGRGVFLDAIERICAGSELLREQRDLERPSP